MVQEIAVIVCPRSQSGLERVPHLAGLCDVVAIELDAAGPIPEVDAQVAPVTLEGVGDAGDISANRVSNGHAHLSGDGELDTAQITGGAPCEGTSRGRSGGRG